MRNVKINQKWDILLPDHRADRPEWYTEKGWERERLDSMYKHLVADKLANESRDVVFYIGAEEGDMAGLLATWGVDVVLFEPNDKVWSNIKAIWDANNLPTPWTYSGFASDKDSGNSVFNLGFPPSANNPIISDHGFKELVDAGDIPQVKIDTITSRYFDNQSVIPTALSIDVEGSEWLVLKGAEQTLRKYRPKIWLSIHPEFMFRMFGHYQFEVRNWIKDLGYEETFIDYQHELHLLYLPKVTKTPEDLGCTCGHDE